MLTPGGPGPGPGPGGTSLALLAALDGLLVLTTSAALGGGGGGGGGARFHTLGARLTTILATSSFTALFSAAG